MNSARLLKALTTLTLSAGFSAVLAQTPPALSASSQIAPAIRSLNQSVQQISVDKWKLSKPVRDTTATNLNSIRKDVSETLPGLLSAADAAPTSVAAMLPISRNLSALYDVVLRVAVIADAAAPPDQSQAIEAAMATLNDARRSFADRLQTAADAQERHVTELQKTASAPPPPPPPTPVCPPLPAPAKKKKATPKPVTPPPTQP